MKVESVIKNALVFVSMALVTMVMPAHALTETLDEAVAVIDEEVVLKSELSRRLQTVKQDLAARKVKAPADDVLRKQVLDRLVSDAVQLHLAHKAGVRISEEELTQFVERIANQNKMSVEQFRAQLSADNVNYALFREDIRNEITISRLRQAQVSRRVFVSEPEVNALMESINAEDLEHSEYHLGHILIPIEESASSEQVQAASLKAQEIVVKLRAGADFGELAINQSSGADALQGGDFGWKSLTQMPSLFATAVKNMKVAEISEPLRSASGLHILKVFDSRGDERTIVRQTHARHILIKPSAILPEEEAEKKIRDLYARVQKGENFAELAKKNSDDPGSANLGGDLGWSNPGQFVPEFEKTMADLAPGQTSQAFHSQYGWHIMQVIERRDDDQTIEAKKQQAYKILFNRKFDEEAEAWERELRDQAYIRILDKSNKHS